MKLYPRTVNSSRDKHTTSHCRAYWPPLWATQGLILCTLLVATNRQAAVYDPCAESPGVLKKDSAVNINGSYLSVSNSYLLNELRNLQRVHREVLDSQQRVSEYIWRENL